MVGIPLADHDHSVKLIKTRYYESYTVRFRIFSMDFLFEQIKVYQFD